MNKRQKEILAVQLKAEKKQLEELKKIYRQSLDQINKRIAELMGREDADLIHVIHQVKYQEQLKKQVSEVLDKMNEKQFNSIDSYIKYCYEMGYTGVMYDLHGQGIQLILPMNPKKIVKAINIDSKLSTTLYKALGENIDKLKKEVAASVTRGIASGKTYQGVARDIAARHNIGMNNSMRIARTEGHRVQQSASLDAMHAAKDAGADVFKQWDATLDSRTRPEHARLDGQIREVDEPFEVDGMETQCPSGFGIAGQDINCHCAILQRARWALDEDELNTLKERAKYYKLDKSKDLEDFQNKYMKATK